MVRFLSFWTSRDQNINKNLPYFARKSIERQNWFMIKFRKFGVKHILAGISLLLIIIFTMAFFSNTTLRFLFKDKIRAHKVNSPELLSKANRVFSGVELDVVFYSNNNNFDINHPPDKSIGFSLDEYFRAQAGFPDFKYWLDFKNLDETNETQSAGCLDSLTKISGISNSNIIVESIRSKSLKPFQDKGFSTSYYLQSGLNKLSEDSLKSILITTTDNLISNKNSYISAEFADYPVLKKYFPATKKLIWFSTYGSMNKISARILMFQILMDENVDVLLIPFS